VLLVVQVVAVQVGLEELEQVEHHLLQLHQHKVQLVGRVQTQALVLVVAVVVQVLLEATLVSMAVMVAAVLLVQ
jgi:hypothetical protein